MDEQEMIRFLRSELYQAMERDPELRAALKRIDAGKGTFQDTAQYSERTSELLGQILSRHVDELPEGMREAVCKALLRERYEEVNGICAEVQEQLDAQNGIRLQPQRAPYPAERVQQVAHALEDPTVALSVIQRRAKAPVANVSKSFHDDYMKKNADVRSRLGFKCYLNRVAATGCCKWCTDIAGRYVYGDHPDEVFHRHDNCSCTVTYENGRERQDVWSKRTWQADPAEVEANGFKPVVNSQERAREIEERGLAGLTKPGQGDIMAIGHRMAATGQNPPDFSLFPVKDEPDAVKKISKTISQELGIPSEKIQLDGIRNTDVLEPFVKRLQKIKADTGMSFPAIRALEIIEGDPTCIASYKPYEDVLYISSRYFNSKDALLATLKDWSANGYLPKQAKSIAYLAEHEAAHIRIPDEWLRSDEALGILRKFNKTKYANDNDRFSIEEFFADSVAWHRVAPDSIPAPMAEAVEFLRKRSEWNGTTPMFEMQKLHRTS